MVLKVFRYVTFDSAGHESKEDAPSAGVRDRCKRKRSTPQSHDSHPLPRFTEERVILRVTDR